MFFLKYYRHCIFLLSNVLFLTTTFSQNSLIEKTLHYNTLMSEGVQKMSNNEWENAIQYFDSAATIFPYYHKPFFQLILCYNTLNDTLNTFISAVKMCQTTTKLDVINQVYLDPLINTQLYQYYIQIQDSIYNQAINKFDSNFVFDIQNLLEFKKSRMKLRFKDTVALNRLLQICFKYNAFPSALNVGSNLYRRTINSIIENSLFWYNPEDSIWKEMKHYIEIEYQKGGIESSFFATIEDIDSYYRTKIVKYGTLSKENFSDAIFLSPMETIKNRKEIGLYPIERDNPIQ
jgi:hypothetical protein